MHKTNMPVILLPSKQCIKVLDVDASPGSIPLGHTIFKASANVCASDSSMGAISSTTKCTKEQLCSSQNSIRSAVGEWGVKFNMVLRFRLIKKSKFIRFGYAPLMIPGDTIAYRCGGTN